MHILQIEIDNFKSFYGRTVVPFRRGFTTVSGPNGSGKSNIVDSLLFCLGLSTSRTMRAEKLTDLINNSARKREAQVRVTFSKNPDLEVLPALEEGIAEPVSPQQMAALAGVEPEDLLIISRRLRETASGTQSTFYINDKPTTLSDVHEHLAQFNVSPGCYNVMMQGDVASIVTMSPVERRKILDELAGIGEFDRKIEQAQAELQTTGSNIERHEILLGEIAERLQQLEGERDKALKYQRLKDEAKGLEAQLQLARLRDLEASLQAGLHNVQQSKEQRKALLAELTVLKRNLQSSTQRLQELTEAVKRKGEDQHLAMQRQLETLRNHITLKQESIALLREQQQETQQQIETHQSEGARNQDLLEGITVQVQLLQKQEQELQGFFQQQQQTYDQLSQQFDSLTNSESAWAVQRMELRRELETISDQLMNLQREQLENQAEQERLQATQRMSAQQDSDRKTQLDTLKRRYDSLSQAFEALEQNKSTLELAVRNASQERGELWAALNRCKEELSRQQQEHARLESRKRALDEVQFGRSVDKILNAGLPGVIGTVGQLLDVPAEYSTAIEVALGGRIQNIVVENDSLAQRCISFLQQQRAGRATFLPLNKIKRAQRLPNPPVESGVIDYAANLVQFDPHYQDVFGLALGDTLIVETLEDGRRLLNRYRMVTLDGSVLERTGAMTGGSSANRSSGMFQGQALDKQLDALEETLEELKTKKSKLEQHVTHIEQRLEQQQEELRGVDQQHLRTLTELEALEAQIQELDGDQVALDSERGSLADANARLDKLTRQLEQQKQQQQALEAQKEALQEKLASVDEAADGPNVQGLRGELTDVKFQMDYYDKQLRQVQSDLKKQQTDVQLRNDVITQHKEQVEQKRLKLKSFDATIAAHQEEIVTTQKQIALLEAQTAELDEELKALQQERDGAQQQLLTLEREKAQLERRQLQLEEQLLALQARNRELEAHAMALREHLTLLYPQEGRLDSELAKPMPPEEEMKASIGRLEKRWQALEPVNMLAIKEYDQVKERQQDLADKVATLSHERETLLARISSFEELKLVNFNKAYENVNRHFSEIYAELGDGQGQLVLTNPDAPLEGGLTIQAQPRGKKMQRMEAMSGGEKSLTSLAFVFALQRTMPAPFYALDEVDQNLDGLNVEKLSRMVQRESRAAQFIVVSLRKPMIENSDRTVGVTQKQNGLSKVTGIQFRKQLV